MTGVVLALVVGVLFATGAYMLLERSPIRLILGLALLSHGVNLLLFSSGGFKRGIPPIVLDKASFVGDISAFVDPLPQALILTAIVISFGVTAFIVVLFNRRNTIVAGETAAVNDPFAPEAETQAQREAKAAVPEDDYEFLEYSLADEYRQQKR
ncbi:MAG: NADH-quinone oxidoreductase subunit K [Caldilineaceae bacterium]